MMACMRCVVGIIAAGLVLGCTSEVARSGAESNQKAEAPSHEKQHLGAPPVARPLDNVRERAFRVSGLPDNALGRELFAYLWATTLPPAKGGDEEMAKGMDALKRHPADVVAVLVETYDGMAKARYSWRWDIVYLLGELRDPGAIRALETIAASPIPPLQLEPGGRAEHAMENPEVSIRRIAAEGLARLARQNDAEALHALRNLMRPELNEGVRSIAVRGYVESDLGGARLEEVRGALAPEDQWMLARVSTPPRVSAPIPRRLGAPPTLQGAPFPANTH
jgi:hypothetical protein